MQLAERIADRAARKTWRPADAAAFCLMVFYGAVVVFPLLWLVSTAFKSRSELTLNVWGPPQLPTWDNFLSAWQKGNFDLFMMNSLFVALLTVLLTVAAATTLAFVLARVQFRWNRPIYFFIIAGMMIPIQSAVIPLYMLEMQLGLQNNLAALAFIYAAFRIPISVFILESFMLTIPKELEECAFMDGASVWTVFSRIIVPLAKHGQIVIIVLAVLACWNELLVAMLSLSKPLIKTLPLGLMQFVSEFYTEYTEMCAAIVIACVPNVIFYSLMQDRIVEGLTIGSIKG
jgi:raffinose/stachyose/melibiose transport system permease protein